MLHEKWDVKKNINNINLKKIITEGPQICSKSQVANVLRLQLESTNFSPTSGHGGGGDYFRGLPSISETLSPPLDTATLSLNFFDVCEVL